MIILIEGNIGSGKSTLLELLKNKYKDKESIRFIDEPVNEWSNIKDNDKSILELFYENKEKYSFTFQILAYITRLRLLLDSIEKYPEDILICERSIFTDKFVFAKMLKEQGYIDDIQWKTYNYWFDTFENKVNYNYIIYVNTEPMLCFERIKQRNRNGESDISLDYLEHCHRLHNEWLLKNKADNKVILFNGNININHETYMTNLDMLEF